MPKLSNPEKIEKARAMIASGEKVYVACEKVQLRLSAWYASNKPCASCVILRAELEAEKRQRRALQQLLEAKGIK
jgi:hypothetical protein